MMKRHHLFLLCLVLAINFASCKQDDGTGSNDAPTILSVTPNLVFPGQENVQGTIRGTNYKGIVAVDMGGDIRILDTSIVNPTELTVHFSVRSDAAPGPKTVRVTTLKGAAVLEGGLSVDTNRAPVASFTSSTSKTGKGQPVEFNASASTDPDGSISKYDWTFGDGATASGVQTSHTFNTNGNFTVELKVTDNKGGIGAASRGIVVENTRAPVPHFSISPLNGDTNTLFRFDGGNSTDDGRITEFEWDFGDGKKDKGKVAHHRYETTRDFDVRLTVTDNHGLSNELIKQVGVRGKEPVADFVANPAGAEPGTIIQFDGSLSSDEDGRIVNYDWDMGDSTKLSGERVTHKYVNQGTYATKLTVTDNSGMTGSKTRLIDISQLPTGGQKCTQPVTTRAPDLYGTIIAENQGARTVTIRLDQPATCATAFYGCGDLKHGGDIIYGGPEKWFGTICQMYYLGNSTFRIHLISGQTWPTVGMKHAYIHWQRCSLPAGCG